MSHALFPVRGVKSLRARISRVCGPISTFQASDEPKKAPLRCEQELRRPTSSCSAGMQFQGPERSFTNTNIYMFAKGNSGSLTTPEVRRF